MERGFFDKVSPVKNQKIDFRDGTKKKGPLLNSLAMKVRNIDGKMTGKDGKPLVPYRLKQVDNRYEINNKADGSGVADCNDVCSTNGNNDLTEVVTSDLVLEAIDIHGDAATNHGDAATNHGDAGIYRSSIDSTNVDVVIPQEEADNICARFENSLYGYFVGKRLAFTIVRNYAMSVWKKHGFQHVMIHQGFFVFKFSTKAGMERVVNHGTWLIRSIPFILNTFNIDSDLKRDDIKKVPVWVKMFNVPVVAFSKVGLNLISSKLGRLIMLDAHTDNICLKSWGKNSYARALIEISADKDFVESLVVAVPIDKGKGHRMVTVDIEFEYKPPRCSVCKIFDHLDMECQKTTKEGKGKKGTDAGGVHGSNIVHTKKTPKGKNQGTTYKAGFKFPKGKPILVYRPVAKANANMETASLPKEDTAGVVGEVVNMGCDNECASSYVNKVDSSCPTKLSSSIQDEIGRNQLGNNINKRMEEEKGFNVNTEGQSSVADVVDAANVREEVHSVEAKGAAAVASSSKTKFSFGHLDLANISDSDEDEVFANKEEFESYLSSVGGGHHLEEEFDLYDNDYADQIRDLPGQINEFRDFQLHHSGRK